MRDFRGAPRVASLSRLELRAADASGEDAGVVCRVAGRRDDGAVGDVEDHGRRRIGTQAVGAGARDRLGEHRLGAGLQPGVEVGDDVGAGHGVAARQRLGDDPARVDGDDGGAVATPQHGVVLRLEARAADDVLVVDAAVAGLDVVGAGPGDPAEQVGGVGARGRRVAARGLGGDADAGELLGLLHQRQRPLRVDAGGDRDRHVGRAVEAGRRAGCADRAAEHRLAPEPVERLAEHPRDRAHEGAPAVVGIEQDARARR